jgi:hypothetical protein
VVVPDIGTVGDVVLGIVISIAEADIADHTYRENAKLLNDLLSQIRNRNEAGAAKWEEIRREVESIRDMKQSYLGYAFEFISYGQGSILEQQGIAFGVLTDQIADEFGYVRRKSWGDIFAGGYGKFEKKQSE